MPQAVNLELLLYADNTCLIYTGKDIQKIEEQLNSDFTFFLDNILSGEHMTVKVLNTVLNRLKFLYRKQKFLSLSLRRLLCNALI